MLLAAGLSLLLAAQGCGLGSWLSQLGDKGEEPSPQWMQMFEPSSIHIGFFTKSRNFDDKKGDDGIEVRVQALDRFGDPTKAVGNWRFEVFNYQYRALERRAGRLCHWFVAMLTPEENERYYDSIDRSYRFPLLWDNPISPGTRVVVQATFYPPGGFERKLIAERIIRVGD